MRPPKLNQQIRLVKNILSQRVVRLFLATPPPLPVHLIPHTER